MAVMAGRRNRGYANHVRYHSGGDGVTGGGHELNDASQNGSLVSRYTCEAAHALIQ